MQAAGVRTVVDAASLGVVGLVEVVAHIPRIWGEFKKLVKAAEQERPALAILTDSPDFHLRLATKLKRMGIPVVYLIAPQVWAWRKGRISRMRRDLARLLCIFPFEEEFFRKNGLQADYIGHPLTRIVRPTVSKEDFFSKHGLDPGRPVITLLPGSRVGEVGRHLGPLVEAAQILSRNGVTVLLATPSDFLVRAGAGYFRERIHGAPIQVVVGETWDAIAHADVALAASGTVTVEAALLGTPMVTFYRVTALSWVLGKLLVRVPFYSMVNLVAERRVVAELMQQQMTGERMAELALQLLKPAERSQMVLDLGELSAKLATGQNPMDRAAEIVAGLLEKDCTNAS
jgi:lipid-A-disaccharide synthase